VGPLQCSASAAVVYGRGKVDGSDPRPKPRTAFTSAGTCIVSDARHRVEELQSSGLRTRIHRGLRTPIFVVHSTGDVWSTFFDLMFDAVAHLVRAKHGCANELIANLVVKGSGDILGGATLCPKLAAALADLLPVDSTIGAISQTVGWITAVPAVISARRARHLALATLTNRGSIANVGVGDPVPTLPVVEHTGRGGMPTTRRRTVPPGSRVRVVVQRESSLQLSVQVLKAGGTDTQPTKVLVRLLRADDGGAEKVGAMLVTGETLRHLLGHALHHLEGLF